MSLACGGRGPCCHIGYPHRHCEACDYVIATYNPYWYQLHNPYWYGTSGGMGIGNAAQLTNARVIDVHNHEYNQT